MCGLSWLPVASVTASNSATSDIASASLPLNSAALNRSVRAIGSTERAPARLATWTCRSVSSSQPTSSPMARAMRQASHSQRSDSSSDIGSSRMLVSACFNSGVPTA